VAFQPDLFLRQFILPLIVGGELHVQRPLDAQDRVTLEAELVTPTDESVAVERARGTIAAGLWLYPVPLALNRPTLELCVALHNLLFLSHPGAHGWWVRASQLARVASFTEACLRRPSPPRTAEELVARHTLLGQVPHLTRTDVEVRFWVGKRSFLGLEPPPRLLRWKGIRNVREVRQEVTWVETELSESQQQMLALLMRQSPLTDLLTPQRTVPPFEWLPVAEYLEDPQICRLVCHHYLAQGVLRQGLLSDTLARAFWQLVQHPDRRALRLVGGLVVYLYAATALTTESKDHLRFNPAHPMEALPVVLMAAAGCGMVPDRSILGDETVDTRLREWCALPTRELGGTADELTRRLQAALAA